ncbi:MAG: LolA family protein [Candidatus Aminicenantia bacterium]
MKKSLCFSSIVLAFFFCGLVFSQTVDEIIAKNLQSKGGIEKLKDLKSVKITGKVSVMGMEMPLTIFWKSPNLFRSESSFQEKKMVQAFDGEKAWMINHLIGVTEPTEIPAEQADSAKEQYFFLGPFFEYKERGINLELLGKEELEGKAVYKLKLISKDGTESIYYLDADSCLELKMETTREVQGSQLNFVTTFSDYREANGLKFAFSIQTSAGSGMTTQIIFESIEINPELDDSLFKMPK